MSEKDLKQQVVVLTKLNETLENECNEAHLQNSNLQSLLDESDKHNKEYRNNIKLQYHKVNAYREKADYWKSQHTLVNEENEELAKQ